MSKPRQGEVSTRERQVLRLAAEGHGTKATARELSITQSTVKTHRRVAMQKLQAKNITDAVIKALALNLISAEGIFAK